MLKKSTFTITITLLIIGSGAYQHYIYSSGRDTVTCSNIVMGTNQNVRGQETNCGPVQTEKEVFNAAGDKVSWANLDKSRKNTEKWGVIAKTEQHTLKFPKSGEKKIISLTPTQGAYKDRPVEILIVSFDKRTEIDESNLPQSVKDQLARLQEDTQFNSVIKIYRKTNTEKKYTEVYEIFSQEYPHKLEIKISITPNGLIKTEQTIKETDVDGNKIEIQPFEIDLASFE
ncbi:hypothetical protein EKK58_01765 [Candidatus Dependentiae bacterium]|nr:MAG: hypothetical protein EKK58_01765 [Candidatus Dependentiae bacterium]